MNEQLEHDAIQNKLGAKIDWPNVGDEPLNEYTTTFLATVAFPCLFPDGEGDPTKGQFPLRKIILGSDRIGTKFNLHMRLWCQFFAHFEAIL